MAQNGRKTVTQADTAGGDLGKACIEYDGTWDMSEHTCNCPDGQYWDSEGRFCYLPE